MAIKKRLFVIVVGVFLLLFLCLYLWIRSFLPINPKLAYFPDEEQILGGLHWTFGAFQPVYLYSFTRGDDWYFKVAYRDQKNRIRIMNATVKKEWDGKKFVANMNLNPEDDPVVISDVKEYKTHFKAGDRIRLTYIRSASAVEGPGGLLDSVDEQKRLFCQNSPMICSLGEYTFEKSDIFLNFKLTGIFPKREIFPVLFVTTDLIR